MNAPTGGRPEDRARANIDRLLTAAGWIIQNRDSIDMEAGRGIAIREFPLSPGHGFADYLLYVEGYAAGVVEANKAGVPLIGVEIQTAKYSVGLRPKASQQAIVDHLDASVSSIAHLAGEINRALDRAARLRQAILKKAFEGKLVPQDPNDEPASVLLQRISRSRPERRRRGELNSRQPPRGDPETMPIDKHLAKDDSQISRLEQVMTALAEAQVRTEDEGAELRRSMSALAKAQAKTEAQIAKTEARIAKTEAQFGKTEAQMAQLSETMNILAAEVSKLSAQTSALGRQWEAYLNTLPKN